MSRTPVNARGLVALVLVALAAGAIAARADGGGGSWRPRTATRALAVAAASGAQRPRAAARALAVPAAPRAYGGQILAMVPQRAIVAAGPQKFAAPAAVLRLVCTPPAQSSPPGAAPTKALLDAFAILRRERRPEDALPPEALTALMRSGLAPVDPASARLLRTTPSGGRAWVVPVPDVSQGFPFPCRPRTTSGAREGLAVVAVGDAAPGGGGALGDLVRGRAPVSVDPCAGQNHDLLGISGIVPNGVSAAFLTAPDGTAVRADVKDNAYEFLVPHARGPEQRYVVWTGGDGTPHVQPVLAQDAPRGAICDRLVKLRQTPQVTPVGYLRCAPSKFLATPIAPAPAGRGRVTRAPVPAPIFATDCATVAPFPLLPPARAPRPARKRR